MDSLSGISHLRIPFEELESATNNFSEEHRIGDRDSETFKGQLLRSGELIDFVAHLYNLTDAAYLNKFQNSVLIHSSLKHKNIVSFIGFHDENDGSYLVIPVTKYETNESLDYYLADPNLTWLERLRICVGVGHALSYLHNDVGDNHFIIHGNIKSSSILLDDNWEAKLTNFKNSIRVPEALRHSLLHAKHFGTPRYMDPIYEKSKGVTYKSDVFSFGVVMFEVLCGREATIPNEDGEFLTESAKLHYEKGTLDTIILPDLWEEMDQRSFKIFSETAYYCLNEQRTQRPNMEQIVKKLEKAMKLQLEYENEEVSSDPSEVTLSDQWKGENFEHLRIKLSDVLFATENFAEKYQIGLGGYGVVYKSELHFEDGNSGEGGMPNTHKTTVAIKRILSREDKQGEHGFCAEIEMLASCNHRNIVSLLGFCNEGRERILVYEYASNGSLDDYLGNIENMTNFTWVQRLNICLNIAQGLNYLHSSNEKKEKITHRDIKSANILLDENWEAKIADFGLSKFQQASTIDTHIAGTEVYIDPEYLKTGRLKKEADVYSFGVVLFEILCGRLAYDQIYLKEHPKGLGPIARRCFEEATLEKMIDPNLKEESDEIFFTQDRGLNEDSLARFSKIAYECLAETQAERPTMEAIIKALDEALSFQKSHKGNLKVSLEDINVATQNFNDENIIGQGEFWLLYKGELLHDDGSTNIVAKRMDDDDEIVEHEFFTELKILYEYKHENIVGLLGYCNNDDERIIVYDCASKGSLDRYLTDVNLTWTKRLRICIDIGSGLDFLHGGGVTQEVVVHRSLGTSCILVNDDWRARISGFGISLISSINNEIEFDINNSSALREYNDPVYYKKGSLTRESDIYSFGVVLVEIMCEGSNMGVQFLAKLAKHDFGEGTLDEIVLEGLKEQIVPQSLITFQKIAFRCLHDKREERPTASEVLIQLKKALEIQEDFETWEAKLPKDYKELIQGSKKPEIYSTTPRKDIYDMLSKGILIQEGHLWFSLGSNGERNRMISARKFSYKHRWSHKWRSIPVSRFPKVAEMLDISDLKIQIKIATKFLTPGVNYGVYLVFRFDGLRNSLAKHMFVNLKYKKESETFHAYFAKWREDEWMMIELCRFLNGEEDIEFDFLLESFSRGYCGSRTVHIEGLEFRAIDNVKDEEIKNIKEAQLLQKSNSNMNQRQQLPTNSEEIKRFENYEVDEKPFSLSKVNKKKHYTLSPKDTLFDSSNVKLFKMKPSTESRFQDVAELQSTQVFRIKCKIENQMFSPNTKYMCYLVFKLSEKCHGLHCPVVVRNLHNHKNKETGILYFRTPLPWNLDDANRVPQERGDGWMEVNVWNFNSNYEIQNDFMYINLKLITYEGTMRGLILRGLEFRPM